MIQVSGNLWFNRNVKEVADFYLDCFPGSSIQSVFPATGTPMVISMRLAGYSIQLLNGGPQYQLDEAFSFVVALDTQEEIDHYWELLSTDGGQPGQCGWLKDKFGVSWQIVPSNLVSLLSDPKQNGQGQVTNAMLKMSKFVIAELTA